MTRTKIHILLAASALLLASMATAAWGQTPATIELTDAEKEEFLQNAEIGRRKRLRIGVTNSERATLQKDGIEHDAHIQAVDEFKKVFHTRQTTEINFRDAYRYNIAAYRLDRLINLNMVPVSVERRVGREKAAVTWWVDEVQMMERDRQKKKISAPDPLDWNDQMYNAYMFNELVYNTDANMGNILITNDWRIRLIDFTRSFRTHKNLRTPGNLSKIDRRVYKGLRGLNKQMLKAKLGDVLSNSEIVALLARRDRIVKFFERKIAERGESAVICDQRGH